MVSQKDASTPHLATRRLWRPDDAIGGGMASFYDTSDNERASILSAAHRQTQFLD
ncbi:MAG: hypothetical protein QNJ84_12145 [Alphaproteobacteria bacterium]|nr:hypothetical protein [Alphaproteobacteria bacterium]